MYAGYLRSGYAVGTARHGIVDVTIGCVQTKGISPPESLGLTPRGAAKIAGACGRELLALDEDRFGEGRAFRSDATWWWVGGCGMNTAACNAVAGYTAAEYIAEERWYEVFGGASETVAQLRARQEALLSVLGRAPASRHGMLLAKVAVLEAAIAAR